MIFVTLGTGVGTGFIIDGKLFEGRECAGTEGGHMVINMSKRRSPLQLRSKRLLGDLRVGYCAYARQTKESMDKHPESLMHKFAKEEGKVSGKTALWRLSKAIKQVGKL